MALTPDQKAVLELLLAGQSYAELEELLGLSQDDVRSRARSGLTELGGADPDRNVGLSDYLLGQADPIGRADVVRHLRQDAADHELAARISEELAEMAPAADLPRLPPAPGGGSFLSRSGGGAAAEPAAPSSERRSPLSALPRGRSRLYAGLGAAAVILIAVVLGVTGVFAGDDEPADAGGETTAGADGETDADQPTGGETSGIPDGQELTRIALKPEGNGDAAGIATIGLSTGDQPYIDLVVENLQQAPRDQAYVVWFMFDEKTGYPLSPIFPEQGSFNDRFAVPPAVVSLIFNQRLGAESIEIALSDAQETLTEIQQAAQDETYQIERPGQTVLEGRIPDFDAAGQAVPDQGQGN
jgi:anti-sigma factor RsiW